MNHNIDTGVIKYYITCLHCTYEILVYMNYDTDKVMTDFNKLPACTVPVYMNHDTDTGVIN